MIFGTELETLEFKRSTGETKEALHDIAAMLNKHGHGEIYFGIRNNGEVIRAGSYREDATRLQ